MKTNTLIAILAASTLSQGCVISTSFNKPTEILVGTAKYEFNPNPHATRPDPIFSYSLSKR